MSSTLDFTPNIVLSHKFSVYLDLADPRVGAHGLPPQPYLLQPKVHTNPKTAECEARKKLLLQVDLNCGK